MGLNVAAGHYFGAAVIIFAEPYDVVQRELFDWYSKCDVEIMASCGASLERSHVHNGCVLDSVHK